MSTHEQAETVIQPTQLVEGFDISARLANVRPEDHFAAEAAVTSAQASNHSSLRHKALRIGVSGLAMLGTVGAIFAPNATASSKASNPGYINVGKGIDGANLGNTMKQVEAKLGAPYDRDRVLGGWSWSYSDLKKPWDNVDIEFQKSKGVQREVSVQTGENAKYSPHTNKGIGIGSTVKEVRHAYPKADCHFNVKEGKLSADWCAIEQTINNTPIVTVFEFLGGRSTSKTGNIGVFDQSDTTVR